MKVYNALPQHNTVYIIMEYVEGITLVKMVRERGRLNWQEAFALLKPVMNTLQAIHEAGFIHRDVSPDNIIIRSTTGEPILLDFGAAYEYQRKSSHSVTLKDGYSPPEQYVPSAVLDGRTDEYALCATIYYVASGQKPPVSNAILLGEEEIVPPSRLGADISPEVEAVLLRGMAIPKGERYESVRELREAFSEAMSKSGTVRAKYTPEKYVKPEKTEKPQQPENTQKPQQVPENSKSRKKGRLLALLVCAVLIGSGAVFALLRSQDKKPTVPTNVTVVQTETADMQQPVDIDPEPTAEPTPEPTTAPTAEPTVEPTPEPTAEPTPEPVRDPFAELFETMTETGVDEDGNTTVLLGGYRGNVAHLEIPEKIAGNIVAGIDQEAFFGNENLISVILPQTVRKIGSGAFMNCTNLETIHFSENLRTIGHRAFQYCDSLQTVEIPPSVINIGIDAFADCKALHTIYGSSDVAREHAATLADQGVTYVDPNNPLPPDGLTYKVLNNNTITVTGYTEKAESLTIPGTIDGKKVTSIEAQAFKDNAFLKQSSCLTV